MWTEERYNQLMAQIKLFPCMMLDGVIISVGKNVTYEQVMECKCKVDPDLLKRLQERRKHFDEDLFEL